MPSVNVYLSCGHAESVTVYGSSRGERQRAAERIAETRVCSSCFRERIEEERQVALEAAEAQASEWELPEIQGSEKQVAWATRIRADFIAAREATVKRIATEREKAIAYEAEPEGYGHSRAEECTRAADRMQHLIDTAFQDVLAETEARFWIETGARWATTPDAMCDGLAEHERRKEVRKRFVVLRPEGTSVSVVTIRHDATTVFVRTERKEAEEFIDELKDLHFQWDTFQWKYKAMPASVPIEHVCASVVADVLACGYSVSIDAPAVVELVVADAFERENPRKIVKDVETGAFRIRMESTRGNALYKAVSALPGARWKKPFVVVPSKAAAEVADLAERLDFYMSPGAREIVESVEAIVVKRTKVVEPERPTDIKVTPIAGGVHADLRDD